MEYLNKIGAAAKEASYELSAMATDKKNAALKLIAEELVKQSDYIISENKKDLKLQLRQELKAICLTDLCLMRNALLELPRA